jgi:putative exporter of polyketide antibiotics
MARQNEEGNETFITIKLWAVIVVIISVFGVLFQSALTHESRITKLETQYSTVMSAMSDVKSMQSETLKDVKALSKQIFDAEVERNRK